MAILALGGLASNGRRRTAGRTQLLFIFVYLGVSLRAGGASEFVPALEAAGAFLLPHDILALAAFLLLSHSAAPPSWFLYLFVALAAGIRWGLEHSIILAGVVTLAMLVRATHKRRVRLG